MTPSGMYKDLYDPLLMKTFELLKTSPLELIDDYKKYYYDRIGHDLGDFGDVSSRKKLRDDLQVSGAEERRVEATHFYLFSVSV